jgi:isochorismate hydrolase
MHLIPQLKGNTMPLTHNVVLVVDAMTDRSAEIHRYSVETTFPKLGETDTTDNVLKLLQETPAR